MWDNSGMAQTMITTSGSSILLYDAAVVDTVDPHWFEPGYWESRGAVLRRVAGRGSVWIVQQGPDQWVLRHYHRGGIIARLIEDHYLWLGLRRTRAYREWHLLAELRHLGLPVPQPIAARITRQGWAYHSDIITRYLPETRPLSALLKEEQASGVEWSRIGSMLSRFHEQGVCHPDLTAHNILLDTGGNPFLVDFDNCRFRPPGRWRNAGVRRLQRSLRKVALESGTQFNAEAWAELESAYRAGLGSPL
jgi:3-deoxy-D-manno-octulosonic acid kinase